MICLDASILIAHLSPHDRHHAAATRMLLGTGTRELVLHPITLAEVLVGGARVGRARQLLADVMAIGVAVAEPDADEPLRLAQLRVGTGLKLPDCCVLSVAQRHQGAVATFDASLARPAQHVGLALLTG